MEAMRALKRRVSTLIGEITSRTRRSPVAKHSGARATSRAGAGTQRAGTGSDEGRHSRLISP